MSFLLFGFIGGLLMAIPTRHQLRSGGQLRPWLYLSAITTAFWTVIAYANTPQLVGPFYGGAMIMMVLVSLGLRARFHGREDLIVEPIHASVFVVLFLLVVIRAVAGSAMVRADDYRAFVQKHVKQREWHKDMAPVDPVHIRLVSKEQAEWKAKQALGQVAGNIGSKYQLGTFTIQKVGTELVWVSPLEYQDFLKWASLDSTPGYVKVSAEDPEANAELVVGKKFVYMESAFFGKNLERHIYTSGHQFRGVTDYSFEVDDHGKAYWVATLFEPTIQFWGRDVRGVVIVDPETGAMKDYAMKDVPAWVDRVLPESFAEDRLTWYGRYIHGWWNSVAAGNDVMQPTGTEGLDTLWLVWGDDGDAYWFTGLTSVTSKDHSLVGFILMDSRTGDTFRYTLSGLDENAVLATVNSKVSNFQGYYGTQPVLVNMYGRLTWVVPVITGQGILQRVALMDAVSNEVVLGNTRRDALDKYRQLLSSKKDGQSVPSLERTARTIKGTVARIAADTREGNTTYYVVLVDDPERHIFTGASTLSVELPIAVPGDKVAIGYDETEESTVSMSSFDLPDFVPRISREQSRANELEQERAHGAAQAAPPPPAR
jgi:hypothetical protein